MGELLKNFFIVIALLSAAGVMIYYLADRATISRAISEEAAFCRNAIKHGLNVPSCKEPGLKGEARR